VTRKLGIKVAQLLEKAAKTVATLKIGQNIYRDSQFESPENLHKSSI
jgi:hypothetical protein